MSSGHVAIETGETISFLSPAGITAPPCITQAEERAVAASNRAAVFEAQVAGWEAWLQSQKRQKRQQRQQLLKGWRESPDEVPVFSFLVACAHLRFLLHAPPNPTIAGFDFPLISQGAPPYPRAIGHTFGQGNR